MGPEPMNVVSIFNMTQHALCYVVTVHLFATRAATARTCFWVYGERFSLPPLPPLPPFFSMRVCGLSIVSFTVGHRYDMP